MSGKWKQLYRDELNDVKVTGPLKLACCDCGLTHEIRLIEKDGEFFFRISEDKRASTRHRGTKEKLFITKNALEKIAAWFTFMCLRDIVKPERLSQDDYIVANRIFEILGLPIPQSIVKGLTKGTHK